ncbi:MAG: extracellular solute-binding protein [Clostridia bacterium]|nr:extracellular solute-binding protein [Clostridia bacterium]
MKRILVALLIASLMLTCLAIPAMAEGEAEGWNNVNAEGYVFPDYSGETLSIMWWGSNTRAEMTEKVIHLWEEHTGAKVEFEWYDGGTYWTQFQAKMAAGTLTDVFQMGNNWLTYYNTIEPLNEYIDEGIIDTTAIGPAMIATTVNQANGDVTGMSNGTNARCFAYNPALFDQAGVAYPTATWTWEDFADAARAIHEVTGKPAITTLEYNSLAYSVFTQWKEGYNFYSMDGTGFAFDGDTEPLAYLFDLLTTLQQEGAIADYGIQNEIGSNIEADWIAYGDAAMVMLSSNQFQALSNVAAENGITLELATIPRVSEDGQSGMVVRSSQQMSMWNGSQKKEMAANFINYFINSVEANKILNCERGVSINSDVLAALKEDADEVTSKVYTIIDLIGSFPDAANTSPAEPAANEEISDVLKKTYFQGLAEGKFASAEEAAELFWAEAQEIWAKFEN